MKIALVVPYRYYKTEEPEDIVSGLVVYTRGLARALVQAGHKVWILCSNDAPHADYEFEGSTVVDLGSRFSEWTDLRFSEVVHAWLTTHNVDVVEAHNWLAPLLVEQLIGGTPCVVRAASGLLDIVAVGKFDTDLFQTQWLDGSSRQQAWSAHMLEVLSVKNADLVLAAGQKAALSAEAMGATRIVQLPLGIPRIPDDVPEGTGVLISVSRFEDPRKGGEFVHGILARIPKDLGVTVLGRATPEEREALIAGAPREAEWITEPVTDAELDTLYRTHRAVIVPSKSESFGLCFLEPLTYGKMTLAFDQPDPSKREWPLWRLGPPGHQSLDQIPRALEFVEKAPDLMWQKTQREFCQRFLWSSLIPQYVESYQFAIARSLARGRTRRW